MIGKKTQPCDFFHIRINKTKQKKSFVTDRSVGWWVDGLVESVTVSLCGRLCPVAVLIRWICRIYIVDWCAI